MPANPTDNDHRTRLLDGMAVAVGANGYAATTIADIVAQAAVSRRTFYQHFQTKADCLVALYEAVNLEGLKVLARQLDPALPWRDQVQLALGAYFTWMAGNPGLVRTLFIDILALGADGLRVRRRAHDQIASFISQTVHCARPDMPALPHELSVALVGGIHELVLARSEAGDLAGIGDLAQVGAEFVRRVFASGTDNNTGSCQT